MDRIKKKDNIGGAKKHHGLEKNDKRAKIFRGKRMPIT